MSEARRVAASGPFGKPETATTYTERAAQPSTLGEALEHLGLLSLREQSLEGLLQRVVDLTRTVLLGNPEASITLLVDGRPSSVVATGQLPVDLDETQYERGHGPCLHAARTREVTEIPDTRTETRWPDYARRAAEHGNLSSLSVPLANDDPPVSGALNIYAQRPNAFDEAGRADAIRFALYAAVAAGNLHLYRSAVDRAANLELALQSRAVIDQAKGILMERYKVTADQAFQMLAQASMTSHIKVRDLADRLVLTGELPEVGPTETV